MHIKKNWQSNIWKYFLIILTNRRNYIPILSLYFLSLPDTTAQQIGIYTGLGWLAGFILEIPSGYIADKIGHKTALIMAKFSMLISTLCFVFGNSLPYFILGSIFISIGFAFTSGTSGAFLHNTLLNLNQSKEFGNIDGKIKANVSLVSAVMILTLPLFTKISLLMPIKIYLIFDIIGIITAFFLFSPKIKYFADDIKEEKIISQLKRFKGTGFYMFSIFLAILGGFLSGITAYKEPFVESLGLPVILIGTIMALSRVVWFIIGHNLKILKKLKIKKLLFYEIFFFSSFIILVSQMTNPYIAVIILAVINGYHHARRPLIQEYYLNTFLINKRYKATMLSIKQMIANLFLAIFTILIGFTMTNSFSNGFLITGISMLVILLIFYFFMKN